MNKDVSALGRLAMRVGIWWGGGVYRRRRMWLTFQLTGINLDVGFKFDFSHFRKPILVS